MITTTLARIRAHGPCEYGWKKLLRGPGKAVADDEPLPFSKIVKITGLDDAFWCCRAEPQHDREWRLFAVWCARRVQRLMKDPRSIAAVDVAERHANGQATDEELTAAHTAAWATRAAAWAAAGAAGAAAWAAWAAAGAAGAAAWATRDAAWDAAGAAGAAAWAAWAAAGAAGTAAWVAEREAQKKKFLEIVG